MDRRNEEEYVSRLKTLLDLIIEGNNPEVLSQVNKLMRQYIFRCNALEIILDNDVIDSDLYLQARESCEVLFLIRAIDIWAKESYASMEIEKLFGLMPNEGEED